MAGTNTGEGRDGQGGHGPGPDIMLGLWASWIDRISGSGRSLLGQGKSWWDMSRENPASSMLNGGITQLQDSLANDPTLRAVDQIWNANPTRDVVPINWPEIARAHSAFFEGHHPVSTLVQVSGFVDLALVVEIEASAIAE